MDEIKLDNFFHPTISIRILIENVESLFQEIIHTPLDSEVWMHKYSYPIGILDAWLLNENYKRPLAELKIASMNKAESLSMIENQLKHDNNIADFNYQLLDFEDEENQDNSFEDHDSQNAKTKVIYCWRSTRLSVPKIAFRLNLDSNFVQKWIEEYKKAVRRQLKINKQKAALKKLTTRKIN